MFLTKGVLFDPSIFSDVKILVVDNDRDTGDLYTALFESYSIMVMATASIEETLSLLNQFVPDILICEAGFLGERVDLLIQKVRSMAENSHLLISICC